MGLGHNHARTIEELCESLDDLAIKVDILTMLCTPPIIEEEEVIVPEPVKDETQELLDELIDEVDELASEVESLKDELEDSDEEGTEESSVEEIEPEGESEKESESDSDTVPHRNRRRPFGGD